MYIHANKIKTKESSQYHNNYLYFFFLQKTGTLDYLRRKDYHKPRQTPAPPLPIFGGGLTLHPILSKELLVGTVHSREGGEREGGEGEGEKRL